MTLQEIISDGQARLEYDPDAFSHVQTDELLTGVAWRQNTIRIYGKDHLEPRLTAWYGPEYRYSSIRWLAQPFTPQLETLREELERLTGFPFNAVLINRYRNGKDAMGWHRDNEPEIDQALIASVSFGATRDFLIRRKGEKQSTSVSLSHGSLLLMHHMQTAHEHALPKRLRVHEERVNLTFRRIIG
ncbi:MAG: alpha-ketoglutarate-dependent dioxygenase AlkB [Flavobacteriales bacterium]